MKCNKGQYYCHTDKVCKDIPAGFNVDKAGMLVKELGYSKGTSCNNTAGGQSCPVHGKKSCPSVNEEKDPKGPIKPYKSPEEIAKKHKVSVSAINAQLKIGIKVEGEHTSNKTDAKITALQHLEELPDYYSKLKKVETKTKKESVEICDVNGKAFLEIIDLISTELTEEAKKGLWDNIHAKRKRGERPAKRGEKGYPQTLDIEEDHKEIASGKMKDEEGYMANIEMDKIEKSVDILRKVIKKPDMQLPAWVQSKITRAADFIDTAAEYMSNDETVSEGLKQARKNVGASKCWPGKVAKGTKMKGGREVPNCVPEEKKLVDKILEEVQISFDNFEPEIETVEESTRIPAQTGNLIAVMLSWKAKTYSLTMFFPQLKMPTRKDVEYEIQKVYPGSRVVQFNVTTTRGDHPIIQVQNTQSKNYLLNNKTIGEDIEIDEGMTMKDFKQQRSRQKQKDKREELKTSPTRRKGIHNPSASPERAARHRANVDPDFEGDDESNYPGGNLSPKKIRKAKATGEISEAKKSEMPCNKPKAQSHGSGETGKSHVVKACSGGQEKLIRFGQKGVKGSPKKEGESEEYANRRKRFQSRHAKNIAKGKMSAAYWANKVKW